MDSVLELKNKLRAYTVLPNSKVSAIANYLMSTVAQIEKDINELNAVHREELSNAVITWVDKIARNGGTLEMEMGGYTYTVSSTKIHSSLKK